MINWFKSNRLLIIGIAVGAIAGFIYWQQVGCISGTCMITSKWPNSAAYGAVMGGLLFSMFKKSKGVNELKKGKENE